MFACCFLITEVFEIVNREREIHHVKDVSENFEKNFRIECFDKLVGFTVLFILFNQGDTE